MGRLCAIAAVLTLSVGVLGCGGADDPPKPKRTAAQIARHERQLQAGRAIFLEHCHSCHSMLGRPHTAKVIETEAPDFDEVQLRKPSYVERRVRMGGYDMQSFLDVLDERDVASIVTYISSVTGRNVDDAAADATPDSVLATGERVFEEQCQACHALQGHPTPRHPPIVGTNFRVVKPSEAFVARRVREGILDWMPSYTNRLSAAEIDAVAAYVSSVASEKPPAEDD
jgi:mono/diheme cytochrome c family protein